jgi:hypothetical protein
VGKFLLSALCLLILTACAVKAPGVSTAPLSKGDALRAVRSGAVNLCGYSGKVRITYAVKESEQRFSGLLKKSCNGDIELKILGLFGVVLAEVTLKNGVYKAVRGGEDVTTDLAAIVGKQELHLINRTLTFPSILPDNSYEYDTLGGLSVFKKGGATLITDSAMNIATIIRADSVTKYTWEEKTPKSAAMNWGKEGIKIDFYGEWR